MSDGRFAATRLGIAMLTLACGAALGGCGISTLTSGFSSGVFGSGKKTTQKVESVTEEQLLSAAKANYGPGGVNVGQVAHGCPQFEISPTQHQSTVYEPGRDGDELGVMHRGEITRTARECEIGPGQVTVRYGFSGRVLLGPRGQAGRVTLPATVTVVDGDGQQVSSEQVMVSVDVTLENPIGYFSAVRTVSFVIPQGSRPGEFSLKVGFSQQSPYSAG